MHTHMQRILIALVVIAIGTAGFATGTKEAAAPVAAGEQKPLVAVSILPQRYFVERIGGDLVDALVLVGEGQSPHAYEPTPVQMQQLAQADIWFLSGTDFEIALEPKISSLFPDLAIVDGTQGVVFRLMESHDHADSDDQEHEEDAEAGVDHDQPGNLDRHTWLGKQPALIMAAHIANNLSSLLPGQADVIEARYQELVSDIQEVFARLSTQLAPLYGRTIYVYHPAFGYFFDEFSLVQEAVETGGKEPTAKGLAELIEHAQQENVAAIFVQKQFPMNAAHTVARAVGAEVVALDPLDPDWLGNIQGMGDALLKAIR